MKLAKAKLLKNLRNELFKMGYDEIKDSITAAEGLFIKRLPSNFYLSLGFTISNFYDSLFTADFYLSKTTLWGATWGDIPREAYKRVGAFLTKEERALYLDTIYNKEGVIDAWWSGDKDEDFDKFIQVVNITEERFLKQDGLFDKVENSSEVKS
ncbi:hypothetical protein [Paraflavitalea speifideaquila]|uniref:hypothetical protein n=1 Tax=Paraflavitalea speifideaquila TaxID=3076558 RepID=UPI0028E5C779|nr:hypothetical protein [Paraflavitalea speifideiaquila]